MAYLIKEEEIAEQIENFEEFSQVHNFPQDELIQNLKERIALNQKNKAIKAVKKDRQNTFERLKTHLEDLKLELSQILDYSVIFFFF